MDTNKTTLVVMAAGMGSRFGGLKQIEPLGPDGQIILDYSVFDSIEAGFSKAVFIIKKEIEHDFREVIGKRIEKMTDVDYAFQEVTKVPEWVDIPPERTKPWGTGHAVLCARDVVKTPFAVINADDYYGKQAYKLLHNHLSTGTEDFCMAGFHLENTLTENGAVSRGICEVNANDELVSVVERTKISNCKYTEDNVNWIELPKGTIVSMNTWGFPVSVFDELEQGFFEFMKNLKDRAKGEYYLPLMVDNAVKAGRRTVKVLKSEDKWYGVTYKEDKPSVMAALKALTDKGCYIGL